MDMNQEPGPSVSPAMKHFTTPFRTALLASGCLIFAAATVTPALAQNFNLTEVSFAVEPESRISIAGNSTVGAFTCVSESITGSGRAGTSHPETGDPFVEASLSTEVGAFDCGNGKMTSDLQKALKKDQHPSVSFTIDAGFARQAEESEPGDYYLRVAGTMTIAGVTRPVAVELSAVREGFISFRVSGIHPMVMSDFGIDPPTALLGIIRTQDEIAVHFDVLISPTLDF